MVVNQTSQHTLIINRSICKIVLFFFIKYLYCISSDNSVLPDNISILYKKQSVLNAESPTYLPDVEKVRKGYTPAKRKRGLSMFRHSYHRIQKCKEDTISR